MRGREERGFEFGDYLGGWGLIDGEGLVEKGGVGVLTGRLIAGFGVLGAWNVWALSSLFIYLFVCCIGMDGRRIWNWHLLLFGR